MEGKKMTMIKILRLSSSLINYISLNVKDAKKNAIIPIFRVLVFVCFQQILKMKPHAKDFGDQAAFASLASIKGPGKQVSHSVVQRASSSILNGSSESDAVIIVVVWP